MTVGCGTDFLSRWPRMEISTVLWSHKSNVSYLFYVHRVLNDFGAPCKRFLVFGKNVEKSALKCRKISNPFSALKNSYLTYLSTELGYQSAGASFFCRFCVEYLDVFGCIVFEVNFLINLSALLFSSSYFWHSCFYYISLI